MDSRKIDLTIFLDLKKAFDTVDHSVLIKKLRAYGIRGSAGDWFESYLKERKQYCAANGHRSNIKNITYGIPQGSCLSPLLLSSTLTTLKSALKFRKLVFTLMTRKSRLHQIRWVNDYLTHGKNCPTWQSG